MSFIAGLIVGLIVGACLGALTMAAMNMKDD